ncbi:MAG: flagellar basal body rod protein FlgB [Sulfurospirillum sp.]|nr:flagellar basal body rod protein FlgB [Sulfurospirillum sp.]
MFSTTKAKPLMEQALNARALRQELIASNIANIDTPFYKARDVDFETTLIQATHKMYDKDVTSKLALAKTNGAHLDAPQQSASAKGTIFLRDGHMARNDANTVDLDVETTEMGKNDIMFNALTAALKKNSAIFRSVIDASSKV